MQRLRWSSLSRIRLIVMALAVVLLFSCIFSGVLGRLTVQHTRRGLSLDGATLPIHQLVQVVAHIPGSTEPVDLFSRSRKDAGTLQVPKQLQLSLTAEDSSLELLVEHNTHLMAPSYHHIFSHEQVKQTSGESNSHRDPGQVKKLENCFYTGTILHNPSSIVAISTCDGVNGFIEFNQTTRYSIHALADEAVSVPSRESISLWQAPLLDALPTTASRRHALIRELENQEMQQYSACAVNSSLTPTPPPDQPRSLLTPQRRNVRRGHISDLLQDPSSPLDSLISSMHAQAAATARQAFTTQSNLVMELMLANDYERYQEWGADTEISAMELANYASALYRRASNLVTPPGTISIAVVGMFTATSPMWQSSGPTVDVNTVLTSFCNWRAIQRTLLTNANTFLAYNDVGHLLTSRILTSSSVGAEGAASIEGYAYVGAMCRTDRACGVVRGVKMSNMGYQGVTLAHELGHNLGMSHDGSSGCAANGFIMQAATCANCPSLVSQWSDCSQSQLNTFLTSGAGSCLSNEPRLCGNGVVDPNEECDSGNPINGSTCCTSTCRLRAGAQCDDRNGPCCSNCQFRSAGTVCRAVSTNSVQAPCDVADTCSGDTFGCPNMLKSNGTKCSFTPSNANTPVNGTCNRGYCQSRATLCESMGNTYTPQCDQMGDNACVLYCATSTDPNQPRCVSYRYTSGLAVAVPDFAPCNLTNVRRGSCLAGVCQYESTLNETGTDKPSRGRRRWEMPGLTWVGGWLVLMVAVAVLV